MYHINEKLVCIDDSPPMNGNSSEEPLKIGTLYVVTGADPPNPMLDTWGVQIAGNKTWNSRGKEVWWDAIRFRKLSELQQEAATKKSAEAPADISIAKKLHLKEQWGA